VTGATFCSHAVTVLGACVGGACSTHGEMRNAHKILIEKLDSKRPRTVAT
jgi:hypothetical protein